MINDLREQAEALRSANALSRPSGRLSAIRQRMARAESESGPARLITAVAAVESLARSLVVHAPGRAPASSHFRYQQVRQQSAGELVEEVLRLYGAPAAAEKFGEGPWELFGLAQQFRNLAVHECTYLPHDRYPALVEVSEAVLQGLVVVGGLLRVVGSTERRTAAEGS